EMIAKDSFPMYALFIDLDPSQVDINVHPTKQEIKFEDEKIIYAFVQSAVKHAMAQFSITPTLDFELDAGIQQLDAVSKPFTEENKSGAVSSSLYKTFTQKNQAHFVESKSGLKHWKDLMGSGEAANTNNLVGKTSMPTAGETIGQQQPLYHATQGNRVPELLMQLHNSYLLATTANGYLLIQQQNAHERILYERFSAAIEGKPITAQRSLFPVTIEMAAADAVLLQELLPDLNQLGFQLEPFGNNTFVVQGSPADLATGNEKYAVEKILEQYKHFSTDLKFSKREKLLRTLAIQQAIKAGTSLGEKEMQQLLEDLFACKVPAITANGKPVFIEYKKEELDKIFGR
ncbi:MAG: DNA mismatch repair protein MutL, partial [Ferruginibacter sp.]